MVKALRKLWASGNDPLKSKKLASIFAVWTAICLGAMIPAMGIVIAIPIIFVFNGILGSVYQPLAEWACHSQYQTCLADNLLIATISDIMRIWLLTSAIFLIILATKMARWYICNNEKE